MKKKIDRPKKVVAKFTGSGYVLDPDKKRIEHDSKILYLDRNAYLGNTADDLIKELLNYMGSGIGRLISNPRIKPGSLRITFQILEE